MQNACLLNLAFRWLTILDVLSSVFVKLKPVSSYKTFSKWHNNHKASSDLNYPKVFHNTHGAAVCCQQIKWTFPAMFLFSSFVFHFRTEMTLNLLFCKRLCWKGCFQFNKLLLNCFNTFLWRQKSAKWNVIWLNALSLRSCLFAR